jgi:short-subunit dehydrogenase
MNIVITGASAGIGYQCALYLSSLGHHVFAVARRKENLEKLERESGEKNLKGNIHIMAGDISDEKFLDNLCSEIKRTTRSVHILINNAGSLVNKPFEELSTDEWKHVYNTNVFAVVSTIRKLLPLFETGTLNHILNISSMGGFQGSIKFKGLSAYSSSKAALVGVTECLAEEFKDRNIAVNCMCLGSVQTEMFLSAFPGYTAASTPEKTAKLIGDFAIEGAAFFNGKIIPVSNTTP